MYFSYSYIRRHFINFFFRNVQYGTKIRKTVVPSDSGYLTTEGSEKTIGDVWKIHALFVVCNIFIG
jgi:hypothetical protein